MEIGGRCRGGALGCKIGDQDAEGVELMLAPQKIATAKVSDRGRRHVGSEKYRWSRRWNREVQRSPTTRGGVQDGLMGLCSLSASETYDLYVDNLPDDFYISEIRVNGANAMENGIAGTSASRDVPFEIVLDSRGGKVMGRVASQEGVPWSGANVMLIPDPPQGRAQDRIGRGSAEEHGQFADSAASRRDAMCWWRGSMKRRAMCTIRWI